MNAATYQGLTQALDAAGLAWWSLGGDGRIIVTERGARVLGVFGDGDAENLLWTHPRLAAIAAGEAARRDELDRDWNLGGDRTWLAPEVHFFFPNIGSGDLSQYAVQRALDPGNYRLVARSDRQICLAQETEVVDYRTGKAVPLTIEREISIAPSPFHEKHDALGEIGPVTYCGYQLKVTLTVAVPERGPIGIWNLIQVPAGGVIRVPTWAPVRPLVVFGDPGPVVEATERGVRLRVDGQNRCKISVPAYAVAGRIGYRRDLGDGRATLLVRQIVVNPSGSYVDAPWEAPQDRGYAVQCYGDDGEIGAFGELEHHVPAESSVDVSQVWCFAGASEAIDRIERLLLG